MNVGDWLRSLCLEQYEATFSENPINEKVPPNLTAEDFKDMGIGIVGGVPADGPRSPGPSSRLACWLAETHSAASIEARTVGPRSHCTGGPPFAILLFQQLLPREHFVISTSALRRLGAHGRVSWGTT
jgi:hypothetical protein